MIQIGRYTDVKWPTVIFKQSQSLTICTIDNVFNKVLAEYSHNIKLIGSWDEEGLNTEQTTVEHHGSL